MSRRRSLLDRVTGGGGRSGGHATLALGALATGGFAAVVVGEMARVWRRGNAPLPAETDDVLGAGTEATRQAVEVAIEGYRDVSDRENALFNLLVSFGLTFASVRGITSLIREGNGRVGPFGDLIVGDRHIHHFVPGIVLAFLSGGASVVSPDESIDRWLAIPFGAGVALTLDESALLLELEDVYWTERGVTSVQITLATIGLLAALALGLRTLRRGEQRVLGDDWDAPVDDDLLAAGPWTSGGADGEWYPPAES